MYLLVSGGHICTPQRDTNMASRYNVFPNISHMKYRTDLILGEALCIFYLLLFPRFWTFCIEWFAILFLIA